MMEAPAARARSASSAWRVAHRGMNDLLQPASRGLVVEDEATERGAVE